MDSGGMLLHNGGAIYINGNLDYDSAGLQPTYVPKQPLAWVWHSRRSSMAMVVRVSYLVVGASHSNENSYYVEHSPDGLY